MSIEFKFDIFNKNVTMKITALTHKMEDTHFTDNKIFIASYLVQDQDNIQNMINQAQSNSLGEKYESILDILSNFFSSSDELNNIFLQKFGDSKSESSLFKNTRLDFNNQF